MRISPPLLGCSSSADKLACLRKVPFVELNAAIVSSGASTLSSVPVVDDGEIVQDVNSNLLPACKFAKRPLLISSNADKDTLFAPSGINTDAQLAASIQSTGTDANTTSILMALYPDILSLGIPSCLTYRLNNVTGIQYKGAATSYGDYTFLAGRRLRNQVRYDCGVDSYAYQFDAPRQQSKLSAPHSIFDSRDSYF